MMFTIITLSITFTVPVNTVLFDKMLGIRIIIIVAAAAAAAAATTTTTTTATIICALLVLFL